MTHPLKLYLEAGGDVPESNQSKHGRSLIRISDHILKGKT